MVLATRLWDPGGRGVGEMVRARRTEFAMRMKRQKLYHKVSPAWLPNCELNKNTTNRCANMDRDNFRRPQPYPEKGQANKECQEQKK